MRLRLYVTLFSVLTVMAILAGCNKAQNVSFSVNFRVVAYGEAVEGVEVWFDDGQKYFTDSDGFVSLSGFYGDETVFFSKDGYDIKSVSVTTNSAYVVVAANKLIDLSVAYEAEGGAVIYNPTAVKYAEVDVTAVPNKGFTFEGFLKTEF